MQPIFFRILGSIWVLPIQDPYILHILQVTHIQHSNFAGSGYMSNFFFLQKFTSIELYMGSIVSIVCIFLF